LDARDWEEALWECRMWLAEQLEVEEVPDDVWGHVMKLGLPVDVIVHRDDESRYELVAAAKDYGKNPRGSSGNLRYDRSEGSEVPSEIAVKPSKNALRRAEAFAEVAAVLADNHPRVKRFRRIQLRNRLLTDEEARAFLDQRCGGPLPVKRGTNAVARRLWKLAERLSKTYLWREEDAVWFVLTGHAPPVRPLEVRGYITPPQHMAIGRIPREYRPHTARITIAADAWLNVKEVTRAFRDAQRQILAGGDAAGPTPERTLEVVRFVARRMRERGEENWGEVDWGTYWRAWKKVCPEGWGYSNENNFKQTFERFIEGVVYRAYEWPNYCLPEKTPYQVYRNDWLKRRKDSHRTNSTAMTRKTVLLEGEKDGHEG
jgi:hypothetical protein